jgi:hypothetical protein
VLITSVVFASPVSAATLFTEGFEDANFDSRGWYDNTSLSLSTTEHFVGSRAVEYRWLPGGTTPTSGGAIRKLFTPAETVYVSYAVKYDTNYTGSNQSYHPHEFMLMTNKNGAWDGMAFTRLTAYIEQNEGNPTIGFQDGENIDQNQLLVDLRAVTENRSVAGCNGNHPDGYSSVSCYDAGSVYWNGKLWEAPQVIANGSWHRVEAYFALNSVQGGIGQGDGVLRYSLDGQLLIDRNNVMYRTNANADMLWNQFIIAPWIGDGSPIDQRFWVDDLLVADAAPSADTTPPASPVNLSVQ